MLSSVPLLGYDRRCIFSSHSSCCVQRSWQLPSLGLFIFKSCVSNTLAFQKNLEYYALFLRAPLWFFVCVTFLEDSEVVVKFTVNFRASCWSYSVRYSWRSPLLLPGCWCPTARFTALWQAYCPLFSQNDSGSKVLWIGLICDCKRCPGKSSPCLLFSSSHDIEGLGGLSSLLSGGLYFCGHISSCSMRRRG